MAAGWAPAFLTLKQQFKQEGTYKTSWRQGGKWLGESLTHTPFVHLWVWSRWNRRRVFICISLPDVFSGRLFSSHIFRHEINNPRHTFDPTLRRPSKSYVVTFPICRKKTRRLGLLGRLLLDHDMTCSPKHHNHQNISHLWGKRKQIQTQAHSRRWVKLLSSPYRWRGEICIWERGVITCGALEALQYVG